MSWRDMNTRGSSRDMISGDLAGYGRASVSRGWPPRGGWAGWWLRHLIRESEERFVEELSDGARTGRDGREGTEGREGMVGRVGRVGRVGVVGRVGSNSEEGSYLRLTDFCITQL